MIENNLNTDSANAETPNDAAQTAEVETFVPPQPDFAPEDLKHLYTPAATKSGTAFRYIAGALINFAKEPGEYGFKDGTESRFECSFDADSVIENRAQLRMLRASLDCLEADFSAGEVANIAEMREALAGIEAVQKQPLHAATSGASVPPTVATNKSEGEPEPTAWPEIAHALHTLATLAEDIHKGTQGDWTSEVSEAQELTAALELARVGVGYLREEWSAEVARSIEWRRKDIEGLEALKVAG